MPGARRPSLGLGENEVNLMMYRAEPLFSVGTRRIVASGAHTETNSLELPALARSAPWTWTPFTFLPFFWIYDFSKATDARNSEIQLFFSLRDALNV